MLPIESSSDDRDDAPAGPEDAAAAAARARRRAARQERRARQKTSQQDQKTRRKANQKERRQANREKMLAKMPRDGRCAEIGVWNGSFTASILEITRPRELVLIDPWDLLAEQSADIWVHSKNEDAEAMGVMFRHVSETYGGRAEVVIRKGFSAEVLAEYPDAYFDWVYIDGNHLYEFVRKDLQMAFAKVRPGGIIAGDDYLWKRQERRHVQEAVLDELAARGLPAPPRLQGQQFMIDVPA